MNNETKEALLNTTLKELLELIENKPTESKSSFLRFTIGKLDCFISPVYNSRKTVDEYEICLPKGILCNVRDWADGEKLVKELNSVIVKYQK
jgi:hypothetical protein